MKIGLFFGSFNPIHIGHLIIAETVLSDTDLEQLWFVVSPQSPFKQKEHLLGEYDRLRMCELATEDHDQLRASNVEFALPRPSYTIDTLTHLAEHYRDSQFSLVMGGDNLSQIHRWKNADALLRWYPLIVYPRREAEVPGGLQAKIEWVEAPLIEISATRIRERVQSGKSIRYLVCDSVRNYIEEHGHYAA